MALKICGFTLGPLENNTYLVFDDQTKQAVVIDPSFNISPVIDQITSENLTLQAVWLTHGHFDHFAGSSQLIQAFSYPVGQFLHEKDFSLWQNGGEAHNFGIKMDLSSAPTVLLKDNQIISVGEHTFEVLPTPGHTTGHVTYYSAQESIAFCGDLIFRYSIGRTDLNGGDYQALINSIETKILTMPSKTILFSGHGENFTIEDLLRSNPFITLHTQQPGSPG